MTSWTNIGLLLEHGDLLQPVRWPLVATRAMCLQVRVDILYALYVTFVIDSWRSRMLTYRMGQLYLHTLQQY